MSQGAAGNTSLCRGVPRASCDLEVRCGQRQVAGKAVPQLRAGIAAGTMPRIKHARWTVGAMAPLLSAG